MYLYTLYSIFIYLKMHAHVQLIRNKQVGVIQMYCLILKKPLLVDLQDQSLKGEI